MSQANIASLGAVNSIGFIRLVCAALVVLGHSFVLGGFGEDPLLLLSKNQIAIGRVPVDIFFCLSGYLIAKSFESRKSLLAFAWARFLRVYPAYWVCIGITAFVLPWALGYNVSWSYFLRNFPLVIGGQAFIAELPLASAGGHDAINGSLWTLPWELKAYGLCALFGLLGGFTKRWPSVLAFAFLWLGFVIDIYSYPGLSTSPAVTSVWRLFTFFAVGMLFYQFRDDIHLTRKWLLVCGALLVAACVVGVFFPFSSGGVFYAVAPLPLAYVVFYAAKYLPFHRINSRNDISYGIYIYGTLILNVLVLMGLNDSWLSYIVVASVATWLMSWMSWHWIEKPSLRAKTWLG